METIKIEEFHARLKAQAVSAREHVALVCPICGTPQSLASLFAAQGKTDVSRAEGMIGFSCEGRLTNAGPWPSDKDKSAKANLRRLVRGCDWTLGGLFRIHRLEVVTQDGRAWPSFEVATPEQAQTLERLIGPNEFLSRVMIENSSAEKVA